MPKVLLIEHDKILREMHRFKFTKEGFEVKVAANGKEGLALMKSFKPNIVLTELMMPVMDGFTFLVKVKGDEEIRNIPIIILTNLSIQEDTLAVLKMGAKDYILKSDVTPAELVKRVQAHLSASEPTVATFSSTSSF